MAQTLHNSSQSDDQGHLSSDPDDPVLETFCLASRSPSVGSQKRARPAQAEEAVDKLRSSSAAKAGHRGRAHSPSAVDTVSHQAKGRSHQGNGLEWGLPVASVEEKERFLWSNAFPRLKLQPKATGTVWREGL